MYLSYNLAALPYSVLGARAGYSSFKRVTEFQTGTTCLYADYHSELLGNKCSTNRKNTSIANEITTNYSITFTRRRLFPK